MKVIGKEIQFFCRFGIARTTKDINEIPDLFEIFPRVGFYVDERITKIHIGWLCFYAYLVWFKYNKIQY